MSHQDRKPTALAAPRRDPRTGQLLPGGPSLNPHGSRTKAHKTYLRQLIGESGEKAYEIIWRIAQGLESYETLAREPGPHEDSVSAAMIPTVKRVPSIRERLDAATILAEHLNGKPSVEIDAHVTRHEGERDYSKLTDAQLAALNNLLLAASAGEVVDAEIVPEPVKADPEP